MKRTISSLILAVLVLTAGAVAQQEKGVSTKTVQRLNRAPVNREILQIKLPRPTETKLPNGLTLLLLERHKIPTVNFELWVNTGSLDDPKDLPGLAKFTADMLREGTAHRSSAQLSSEIDAIGGSLSADVEFGATHTQVTASGFSENTDKVLDVLSDVVLNPAFPAEELEKYKKRQTAALDEQRSDPSFLSEERLYRALYGESPAAVIAPTPASIQAVSTEQLKQFHSSHYAPNNAVLGIAGDFDSRRMTALVQRYFGGWKQQPSKGIAPPSAAPGPRRVILVDRPDSVQTNILVGELAVPRNHPDYFGLRVMDHVLGGGASARLFLNLREDKGYTYGAYSSFEADTYPRPLLANTEVRTAVTDGSMHELLGELNRLREEPVPATEMDEARRAIVANFALSLERQTSILRRWLDVEHNQLPLDYWDRYPAEIGRVGPESIQSVAKKYVDPNHLQIVCVGRAREIKDVLTKYGPVEVYDVDGKKIAP
jgi:predicted Zn-dependent peptidase